MTQTNIAADLADTRLLAHRYDDARDDVHFLHVPWADRREMPFLSDEAVRDKGPIRVIPAAALSPSDVVAAPVHFIFHSAFCASTWLLRVLEQAGTSALSEPQILNDLIGALRRGKPGADIARVLDIALALSARPEPPGQAVVIKPSNLVNHLAKAMMALRPDSKAVFLFAPLDIFLASVARKGLWCRLWVRELLGYQLDLGMIDMGFSTRDYLGMSDLQVAALGWMTQFQLFETLETASQGRLLRVDSEMLTQQPEISLERICGHFGIALEAEAFEQLLHSPVVNRHSKFGHSFSADDRLAERRQTLAAHGDEIEKVAHWAREVARQNGLPDLP